MAARGANFALQNCDFLLAIGVRLDFAITGYAPEKLARAAHKVMVDIDPAELAKLHRLYRSADSRRMPEPFSTNCCGRPKVSVPPGPERLDGRCAAWKTRYPVVTDEHRPAGRVSIYRLAEVIGSETEPEDLLVSGSSGSGIEIFLLACPTRTGQRIYHTAGLGAMGFGLPRHRRLPGRRAPAHGLRRRRRRIPVQYPGTGDGRPAAAADQVLRAEQRRLCLDPRLAAQLVRAGATWLRCRTGLTVPDISRVAAAYGFKNAVIEDQRDLPAAVPGRCWRPGPVVCDVRVIPEELREPRLSSMQRADGSFVSKPLEDLLPFLDREEFLSNMIVDPLPE